MSANPRGNLISEAFDNLLAAVEKSPQGAVVPKINNQTYSLPENLSTAVKTSIDDWRLNEKMRRLWSHDSSLWTSTDEGSWLGWLGITQDLKAHSKDLKKMAEEVKKEGEQAGLSHVLLLGMGGSSLCPEVLQITFGKRQGIVPFATPGQAADQISLDCRIGGV